MMASSYNAKEEDRHQPGATGHVGAGTMTNKMPDNTAFKQQRLPAWQPILTAGTVLPAFFVIGLIFIPIGVGLFVTSNNIKEFEIDYTGVDMSSPCYNCSQSYSWNNTKSCTCSVPFSLDQPFESNVFMYYGLSNFYQNHRRYVKSRDDSQLNGDKTSLQSPSKECEPYRSSDKPIAPCGAIANSLFNGTSKPVNWRKPVFELDPSDSDNNGFINEDFIVWMRTAALPTFRKLYRIIQKKPNNMTPTLPRGEYILEVTYNYPVRSFDGRKRMILSAISWMGGKNPFLGIAYITVGSVCFCLGLVLLSIHYRYGKCNNSANISS
ncbi:cell cycle control protein 50A isoform X2 [Oncorhynchus tshawytscha]|uniref:cell cycle control protein 50A isoform X2 n=1 Tax=Oncorhynchus tshawytscha TaxID=74940 RepID=UPI000D0A75A6|nr:cell cycle control protein 50A isoform X2 [Oncorhynchus tshawytscha]